MIEEKKEIRFNSTQSFKGLKNIIQLDTYVKIRSTNNF